MTASYKIYPCGDHAITIELGDSIDVAVNNKVISLFNHLKSEPVEGVKDIIPSYHTVTVVYDLLLLKKKHAFVFQQMHDWLYRSAEACSAVITHARQVRIPVYYDTSYTADISFIAEQHGLSADEVISIHASKTYRVYLIGFLPGFAYMGTVDPRIATPRKTSPRVLVPAGSIGIAGEQTGIYPFDSPGGWQLLGQTPLSIFDITKPQPCLLQPGDEVQFYSITIDEFKKIKADGHPHP